jgi:hypothetical protein
VLFYSLSLVASTVLCIVVLILLTHSLVVNWERKNRHPASFLMPVVLTVVLLYASIGLALPCLMDLVSVADGSSPVEEVTLAEMELGKASLTVAGKKLHFNPRQFSFADADAFRIKYTKRSNFILDVSVISRDAGD